jgi:hypothetical protein
MDRRQLLASVGALAGGLAGCVGTPRRGRTTTTSDGRATTTSEIPLARHGRPSTICEEEIRADTNIYAITDPAFGDDWEGVAVGDSYLVGDETGLAADGTVIGVVADGVARAYPVSVLWWHEIVNDTVGGRPLLVTHCPICRSGMVAERRVDGDAATFAVSGLLWQPPSLYGEVALDQNRSFGAARRGTTAEAYNGGNLVMYDDATRSYWSQLLAKAICGPKRGTELTIAPSTVATWEQWRSDHPDTDVLLPPPYSTTTVSEGETEQTTTIAGK